MVGNSRRIIDLFQNVALYQLLIIIPFYTLAIEEYIAEDQPGLYIFMGCFLIGMLFCLLFNFKIKKIPYEQFIKMLYILFFALFIASIIYTYSIIFKIYIIELICIAILGFAFICIVVVTFLRESLLLTVKESDINLNTQKSCKSKNIITILSIYIAITGLNGWFALENYNFRHLGMFLISGLGLILLTKSRLEIAKESDNLKSKSLKNKLNLFLLGIEHIFTFILLILVVICGIIIYARIKENQIDLQLNEYSFYIILCAGFSLIVAAILNLVEGKKINVIMKTGFITFGIFNILVVSIDFASPNFVSLNLICFTVYFLFLFYELMHIKNIYQKRLSLMIFLFILISLGIFFLSDLSTQAEWNIILYLYNIFIYIGIGIGILLLIISMTTIEHTFEKGR